MSSFMSQLVNSGSDAAAAAAAGGDLADAVNLSSANMVAAIRGGDPSVYRPGQSTHGLAGCVVPSARHAGGPRPSGDAAAQRVVRVVGYEGKKVLINTEMTAANLRRFAQTTTPAELLAPTPEDDVSSDAGIQSEEEGGFVAAVPDRPLVHSGNRTAAAAGTVSNGFLRSLDHRPASLAPATMSASGIPVQLVYSRFKTQLLLNDLVQVRGPDGAVQLLVTVGPLSQYFDVGGTAAELEDIRVELLDQRPVIGGVYVVSLSGLTYLVRGEEHTLWHVREYKPLPEV